MHGVHPHNVPGFSLHFPIELGYGYLRFEGNGKIPSNLTGFMKSGLDAMPLFLLDNLLRRCAWLCSTKYFFVQKLKKCCMLRRAYNSTSERPLNGWLAKGKKVHLFSDFHKLFLIFKDKNFKLLNYRHNGAKNLLK